jgi:hypothetical protein
MRVILRWRGKGYTGLALLSSSHTANNLLVSGTQEPKGQANNANRPPPIIEVTP